MKRVTFLMIPLCAMLLSGCGRTGPLYLPHDPHHAMTPEYHSHYDGHQE